MIQKKWADVLQIISGKNQKSVMSESGQYPIYGSGGIIGYATNYLCEAGTTIVGRKGTINRPIFVNEQVNISQQIESRLSVCDNIEKTVDAALQQAEALRQSILKKAFEGGIK